MTSQTEVVWAIRGKSVDPSAPMQPVTVHDLRSRRCRYQTAPRDLLTPLMELGGMAKFSALWMSHEGENGRWQLIDVLPDNVRVLP
jgi:hypothetical protein